MATFALAVVLTVVCGCETTPKVGPQALSGQVLTLQQNTINLEWRPGSQLVFPGDQIDLELHAVSATGQNEELTAVELIFTWDPGVLTLVGLDGTGAVPSFVSRFRSPGGLCELNETIPAQDGDGLYSWLAMPGNVVEATPAGVLLTTFQFDVITGTVFPSQVDMPPSIQGAGEVCQTEVTSGLNRFALGSLDVGTVDVGCINDTQCPASAFCDEAIRFCLADCNGNGVADGTEPNGDFDGNGLVNLNDYTPFAACLGGPCAAPCTPAAYEDFCCILADTDQDGDVDLRDFAAFAAAGN